MSKEKVIKYPSELHHTKDGVIHSDSGPAIIYNDGSVVYFKNGLKHNAKGPAVVWADGSKEWWFGGRFFTEEAWINETRRIKISKLVE